MRARVLKFVLKLVVKYLQSHPDLIPGEVDNWLVAQLAGALGV
ncbi:hypothetical protein DSM43518_02014 [Mycobacterium marinum]|nr:hypothetical protein [Mycobacterium marinum]RFZ11174.1 hypothetical protein DSM43518_02014 [Mycobacterium marinum]